MSSTTINPDSGLHERVLEVLGHTVQHVIKLPEYTVRLLNGTIRSAQVVLEYRTKTK